MSNFLGGAILVVIKWGLSARMADLAWVSSLHLGCNEGVQRNHSSGTEVGFNVVIRVITILPICSSKRDHARLILVAELNEELRHAETSFQT
eukprot:3265842-Amphidinium_carterae.1